VWDKLQTFDNAISVRDLTKIYPGNVIAVDHASFEVRRGEIFGLLGLNGAGKSTTIKMLATIVSPTSGDAQVLGYDTLRKGLEIRKRIGVVQQLESYDRNLTVRSSLSLYASLWGVKKKEALERIDSLVARFELGDLLDRKIRWLSYGQRRRIQVMREFLHDSELLILDEPTAGMDVLARRSFLQFCKEKAKDEHNTIFYTTHIISEAEYICDRIALIHHGRIIALDSPKELKKKYTDLKTVSIVLKDSSRLLRLATALEGMRTVANKEIVEDNSEIRIVSPEPFRLIFDLSNFFQSEKGYELESVSMTEPSLEEVIVRLVGDQEASTTKTVLEREI
jgi:ABC-2 type transport system ATP-binding protein